MQQTSVCVYIRWNVYSASHIAAWRRSSWYCANIWYRLFMWPQYFRLKSIQICSCIRTRNNIYIIYYLYMSPNSFSFCPPARTLVPCFYIVKKVTRNNKKRNKFGSRGAYLCLCQPNEGAREPLQGALYFHSRIILRSVRVVQALWGRQCQYARACSSTKRVWTCGFFLFLFTLALRHFILWICEKNRTIYNICESCLFWAYCLFCRRYIS